MDDGDSQKVPALPEKSAVFYTYRNLYKSLRIIIKQQSKIFLDFVFDDFFI